MLDISVIELEILSLAQQGHSRVAFKRSASKLICMFFRCTGLDIFIRDEDIDYTWIVRRTGDGDFTFTRSKGLSESDREYRVRIGDTKDHLQYPIVDRDGTRILAPLVVDDTKRGLIAYFRSPKETLSPEDIDKFRIVTAVFGKAVFFRNTQAALQERVKELTCIYEITKIMHRTRGGIESMLQDVAGIVPRAFQYDDSASSRIVLDKKEYVCGDVGNPSYSLKSEITIGGKERGFIEVSYDSNREELEERPFLKEEQNLLDGIAKQLSLLIEEDEAAVEKAVLEEQLRHTDRLGTIGQLAAGVAHEINEPLANILGFSELIKKDPGLTEQTSRDIDKIIRASMFARDTVKKLLVFAGKIQPGITEINLNSIIEDGVLFFENRCRKNSIELQMTLDPDLPSFTADTGQINQVLINLLVNSIQALPAGGVIEIHSGSSGEWLYFSIKDNGTGIPAEILDKIFLPFFTTKGIGEGTGLGLVVVHGIVTAYHGKIDVESVPGEFTCFTVKFPMRLSNE